MRLLTQIQLITLLLCLPLVAGAELVRCTSADGKSSTLQRGKCNSASDTQTAVAVTKPSSDLLEQGLAAYKACDYAKALSVFQPLAEHGNQPAQILLGDMYHNGLGVKKDNAAAYAWTLNAAVQGNAKAQSLRGVMYQEGWGAPKDAMQAATWFHLAAEQGYVTAQVALGFVYSNGRGVHKDAVKAISWFRKAAEGGDAVAQLLVGMAYHEGKGGLIKDDAQAKLWLHKAADQGNADAKAALLQMNE